MHTHTARKNIQQWMTQFTAEDYASFRELAIVHKHRMLVYVSRWPCGGFVLSRKLLCNDFRYRRFAVCKNEESLRDLIRTHKLNVTFTN